MNPALIPIIGSLFGGLIDTVKEVVPDKDKQLELTTKMLEHQLEFQKVMLAQSTVPWVDALVKLAYAGEQIVKGLVRPVASVAMGAFAAWAAYKQVPMPQELLLMFGGAPLAWGLSRHLKDK